MQQTPNRCPLPLTRRDVLGLCALAAVASLLALRQLGNDALGYPDADRILMDGVFFRDLLIDLPITRIYDYTINYFGQYPALSIGYRPPFFPFVAGLFNAALGVDIWVSRLALLGFLLAGLGAFYLLVRRAFGSSAAVISGALLVTTPFYIQLSWYTMAEIPVVAMALITALFYARYVDSGRTTDLVATCVFAVLAIYTKQTAVFLVLWIAIHQLGRGTLLQQLRQRRVWVASAAALVVLIPLGAITLWLGDQNIAQSVGTGENATLAARADWGFLLRRLHQLRDDHLTIPILAMAMIGLVWGVIVRDRRLWFWGSYVLAVYLFFTYILGSNSRYPIFWIPAFTLFAALPVTYLAGKPRPRALFATVAVAAILWQMTQVYATRPKFASGYDQAASYVMEHSESPTVFFDGYNNGYFTYFVRRGDPDRGMYVLRGDKLLSSSAIASNNKQTVHVKTAGEISDLIDRFGVQFIVVESRNTIDIPIHGVLRELLRDDPRYVLRETIPVETGVPSTRPPLKDLDLLIYERVNRPIPTGGVLSLELPVVGKTIEIPLREISNRKTR